MPYFEGHVQTCLWLLCLSVTHTHTYIQNPQFHTLPHLWTPLALTAGNMRARCCQMCPVFPSARWDQAFNEWVKRDYNSLTSSPPTLASEPTDGAEGRMSIYFVMHREPWGYWFLVETHLEAFNNYRPVHLSNVLSKKMACLIWCKRKIRCEWHKKSLATSMKSLIWHNIVYQVKQFQWAKHAVYNYETSLFVWIKLNTVSSLTKSVTVNLPKHLSTAASYHIRVIQQR